MIASCKNIPIPNNPHAQLGHDAEVKMAACLEETFGGSDDIMVFNDLHIKYRQHKTQIDHLIAHRHGFVLIETKYISDTLLVNRNFKFSRHKNGRKYHVRSPLSQAEKQRQVLVDVLNYHRREIFQGRDVTNIPLFSPDRLEILISIVSPNPVIVQPDSCQVMDVDEVCDTVQAKISTSPDVLCFSTSEMDIMKSMLLCDGRCRQCHGGHTNLENSGTYFLRCNDCGSITHLLPECVHCGNIAEITKMHRTLYRHCQSCKTTDNIYTAPKPAMQEV